jgi:hypothetical protein
MTSKLTYNEAWMGLIPSEARYHVNDFENDKEYYIDIKDLKPALYILEFGKYKGYALDNIPMEYVEWLKNTQSEHSLIYHCLMNIK